MQPIVKPNGQRGGRGLMMLWIQETYACPVNFEESRLPLYPVQMFHVKQAHPAVPHIPQIHLPSVRRSRQSSAIDWAVADTANTVFGE